MQNLAEQGLSGKMLLPQPCSPDFGCSETEQCFNSFLEEGDEKENSLESLGEQESPQERGSCRRAARSCWLTHSSSWESDSCLSGDTSVGELLEQVGRLQEEVGREGRERAAAEDRCGKLLLERRELRGRILSLEEEGVREEQRREEERRSREEVERVGRETRLVDERDQQLLHDLEREALQLREERDVAREGVGRLAREKMVVEEEMNEVLNREREECREAMVKERRASRLLIEQLRGEMVEVRKEREEDRPAGEDLATRINELEKLCQVLDENNRSLCLRNEELQGRVQKVEEDLPSEASLALKEGQKLLASPSLAQELEALGEGEVREAAREQQEANRALRSYIDTVLMIIMEKHPELLEIISKE